MDAVEDVKNRLSIEDVVGEYVQLKRAGRNFRGLSPFSNERTPSFMVSPEKQIWHDFSSGKGGNVFSFVMEMEGVDFKTALEILARKAGVDLTQYQNSNSGQLSKTKERLHSALELATKFYQIQFTKNRAALDYILKERAFSREIALLFKIGYSPNTGDSLLKFLTKKGFSTEELQQAGLANRNYRQVGDMFRGRIMIPLSDAQGRVIGFTARLLLPDDNGPKYINTPQTLLYDKSRHVYGLHLAKESIRKCSYVVVAEGNLDVVASHQASVGQVVATAGTAVTEQQIKILANFTSDIRLAFDQDSAGQTATERTIPVAAKAGINLGVVSIEGAKDADELIRKDKDGKEWQKAIDKPVYALDWLMATYLAKVDINSAVGKREFSDTILPFISRLPDPVEQDHYLTYLADVIKVSKSALRTKTDNTEAIKTPTLRKPKVEQKELDKNLVEQTKNQDQILALAIINPELRKYIVPFFEDMLMSDDAKTIFKFINENPDFKGDPLTDAHLSKSADYVKMLMLQYETLYQGLDQNELIYEAKRLQDRLITKYVKTQKGTLATAIHGAGKGDINKLLEQDRKLNNLLKQSKEVLHG
jgi:DNA primase